MAGRRKYRQCARARALAIVDWQGNDAIVWVCERIVAVSMDRFID
jgi:hypothetical protein